MKNLWKITNPELPHKKIHQRNGSSLGVDLWIFFFNHFLWFCSYTPLKMNTFFEAKTGIWMEDVVAVCFFSTWGWFFSASFAVSFWRSFFFERKNFVRRFRWNLPGGERTGLRLALWPYRRMFSICLTLEPFDDRCFGDRLAGGGWENDTWRHLVVLFKLYTHTNKFVLANYCFLGITYCDFGSVKPNSVQLKQRLKVIHVHRGIIIWYGSTPGSTDRSAYSSLSADSQALLEACTKSQIVHSKFHAESRGLWGCP